MFLPGPTPGDSCHSFPALPPSARLRPVFFCAGCAENPNLDSLPLLPDNGWVKFMATSEGKMAKKDILAEILRDTNYSLSIFDAGEIKTLNDRVFFKDVRSGKKPYVQCLIREQDILLKPEEIVRQLYISKLINKYGYAKDRIAVEKKVYFGSAVHEKAA